MTLLYQIQRLLERTYADIGINLEHCLIGPVRCADLTKLAGPEAEKLSADGKTFLRLIGDRLYLAIFFSDPIIAELEKNDPRQSLNERNIAPLITFVEEIAHGVQAALLFTEGEREIGSESFIRNLECQAKVDVYLVLSKFAYLLCGSPLPKRVRRWLQRQVFDESHRQFDNENLRERYRVTQEVAWNFISRLQRLPLTRRQAELRRFRALSWPDKAEMIPASNKC
jgi:hypothetical protein